MKGQQRIGAGGREGWVVCGLHVGTTGCDINGNVGLGARTHGPCPWPLSGLTMAPGETFQEQPGTHGCLQ